jgi:hypothetical protein
MPEHKTFADVDVTGCSSHSSDLDELSLSAFGAGLKRIFLPGGQILFRENEVADSVYIVISGCLGVVVRGNDGHDVLVARIPAGETVGEMGFLDGGIRSATELPRLVAIRSRKWRMLRRTFCSSRLWRMSIYWIGRPVIRRSRPAIDMRLKNSSSSGSR